MPDKRKDPEDYRKSLVDRSKHLARVQNIPVDVLRRKDASKRFLSRLSAVSKDWALKGAFRLETKLEAEGKSITETTRDVDISAQSDRDTLVKAIRTACETSINDYFDYEILSEAQSLDGPLANKTVTIGARISGRRWVDFKLDVGVLDPLEASSLETADLGHDLDDNPLNTVRAQPVEFALAEKLHAHERHNKPGKTLSRTQDVPDMLILAELAREEGVSIGRIREAVKIVFEQHPMIKLPIPECFPPVPPEGASEIKARVDYDLTVEDAYQRLAKFWNSVL